MKTVCASPASRILRGLSDAVQADLLLRELPTFCAPRRRRGDGGAFKCAGTSESVGGSQNPTVDSWGMPVMMGLNVGTTDSSEPSASGAGSPLGTGVSEG
jgi:hypothetical protein